MCVYVVLHEQIVLLLRDFLGQIEITTFKSRFKQKSSVFLVLQLVNLAIINGLPRLRNSNSINSARAEARVLGFFSEILIPVDEHFDI